MLAIVRTVSQFLSQAIFPISFFKPEPQFDYSTERPEDVRARDNRVDAYLGIWTVLLIVAFSITYAFENLERVAPSVTMVFAWLAAYRTADIVVSRIYILSAFAGLGPFPTLRARRSLLGSMVVLGQLILAFALMFDGWTGGTPGMWMHPHLIWGFAYISMRVIFTLGPPEEATMWPAKLLIGGELMSGFTAIALGIASYLGSLSGTDRTRPQNDHGGSTPPAQSTAPTETVRNPAE